MDSVALDIHLLRISMSIDEVNTPMKIRSSYERVISAAIAGLSNNDGLPINAPIGIPAVVKISANVFSNLEAGFTLVGIVPVSDRSEVCVSDLANSDRSSGEGCYVFCNESIRLTVRSLGGCGSGQAFRHA